MEQQDLRDRLARRPGNEPRRKRTHAHCRTGERRFREPARLSLARKLRKNVLHALALGDAFKTFGLDQRHALWAILAYQSEHEAEQPTLFSKTLGTTGDLFKPMDSYETVCADYTSFRLSTHGHPMQALRERIKTLPQITTAQARAAPNSRSLRVAGMVIVTQRPPTANGTCFATLEDESGFLDLIFRKEVFAEYKDLFLHQSFLIAHGAIQRDGLSISMIVKSIAPLT